jgi:hypothetical protein
VEDGELNGASPRSINEHESEKPVKNL